MLNYNSIIKNEINQENVSVKEIFPVMKINLRGKKREFLTNVGKNLFVPMENKNINVTVANPVFYDEKNERLNA